MPRVWQGLTASITGAAHRRAGRPNQDAVRLWPARQGSPLLLVLADGHGSARCFRSAQGARIAVAVTRAVLAQVPRGLYRSATKSWVEQVLPRELVRQWRERVVRACQRRPFRAEELAQLTAGARAALAADPALAYGSTLVAIAIFEHFIIFVQLGDGDILTLSTRGEVCRPIPRDPRLMGNVTTSLCSPQAWRDVEICFHHLAGEPPVLILAATDGYANAFRDEANFRVAALDYWIALRPAGAAGITPQLPGWLEEASVQGSGDDISLGLLWRPDARTDEDDVPGAAP